MVKSFIKLYLLAFGLTTLMLTGNGPFQCLAPCFGQTQRLEIPVYFQELPNASDRQGMEGLFSNPRTPPKITMQPGPGTYSPSNAWEIEAVPHPSTPNQLKMLLKVPASISEIEIIPVHHLETKPIARVTIEYTENRRSPSVASTALPSLPTQTYSEDLPQLISNTNASSSVTIPTTIAATPTSESASSVSEKPIKANSQFTRNPFVPAQTRTSADIATPTLAETKTNPYSNQRSYPLRPLRMDDSPAPSNQIASPSVRLPMNALSVAATRSRDLYHTQSSPVEFRFSDDPSPPTNAQQVTQVPEQNETIRPAGHLEPTTSQLATPTTDQSQTVQLKIFDE